jgi:hypothetical protein
LEDNHDSRPLVDRLYDKQREHNALVARLKEEKVGCISSCCGGDCARLGKAIGSFVVLLLLLFLLLLLLPLLLFLPLLLLIF